MPTQKNILVFTYSYTPGYKGGGPSQSITNLTTALEKEYNFRIVTRDRDVGDKAPFREVPSNTWTRIGKRLVFYTSGNILTQILRYISLIRSVKHDIVYLNSFFNLQFTIIPLFLYKFHFVPDSTILLAPRGEFSNSALSLKQFKKKFYLLLSRILRLQKMVIFQATSPQEHTDILNCMGTKVPIFFAPNIITLKSYSATTHIWRKKDPGSVHIVYIGRISPIKNIHYAIQCVLQAKGDVYFDLYGPCTEQKYKQTCLDLLKDISDIPSVRFLDSIPHDSIKNILQQYDLFFSPSSSENFGHGIIESFSAGIPVLISKGTPWQELSKRCAGWDIALERKSEFVKTIEKTIKMDNSEFLTWHYGAYDYIKTHPFVKESITKNRIMYETLLDK